MISIPIDEEIQMNELAIAMRRGTPSILKLCDELNATYDDTRTPLT
jgi:hypothetical protein